VAYALAKPTLRERSARSSSIIITESWYSGDLKINLLTKRNRFPRYGVQTVRVTELVRQEPDSTLFAIPDEYKLIKETVQQPLAQGSGAPEGTPPANSAWSYGPRREWRAPAFVALQRPL